MAEIMMHELTNAYEFYINVSLSRPTKRIARKTVIWKMSLVSRWTTQMHHPHMHCFIGEHMLVPVLHFYMHVSFSILCQEN